MFCAELPPDVSNTQTLLTFGAVAVVPTVNAVLTVITEPVISVIVLCETLPSGIRTLIVLV